jgi:hypothetical protein
LVGSYQPFFPNGRRPAAQDADCCRDVAAALATDDGFNDWGAGVDFRQFQRQRAAGRLAVANVATVAAPRLPWSNGLSLLRRLSCPAWLTTDRWERLVYEAGKLSNDWGDQAHALGWTTLDLFGCNPAPWASRLDRNGLVMTLVDWRGPIKVCAMTTDRIALEVDRGHRLHFYRSTLTGAVPLWIGYAQEGGP